MRVSNVWFWLLFSLSALPGFAAQPVPLGFLSSSSPNVPSAVRAQQKFIFRIELPYFSEAKAEHYQNLLNNPHLSKDAKEDLRRCQTDNAPTCYFRFTSIQGTGFLDQDGQSIWTNCHIVHNWITHQRDFLLRQGVKSDSLLKKVLSSPVPLRLNQPGFSEFSWASSPESPALLEAAMLVNRLTPENLECSLIDDAVKIRLPAPLAPRGIPRSQARPYLFDPLTLYLGGFPRRTDTRQAYGIEESNGASFYWTKGDFVPRGEPLKRLFPDGRYNLVFHSDDTHPFLADSAEGMSGGPVLNGQGELVGIYKGYLPLSKEQNDIPVASIFFSLGEMRFIEIFSEGL